MPISNRPNLEAFINKGGSSSASVEEFAPKTVTRKKEKAAAPRTNTVKKTIIVEQPAPSKAKGRPRKVKSFEELKFVMRIPPNISDDLARVIDSRKVPMSRNAWILEAIVEKLEKEIKP